MVVRYLSDGQPIAGVGSWTEPPAPARTTAMVMDQPMYLDALHLRHRQLEQPQDILQHVEHFFTMSHLLVELDLSRNLLSDLPFELNRYLPNLRHLNLACNRLTCIPKLLLHLPQLQHLNLSENQLTHLDGLAAAVPRLKTFRVGGNRLAALDDAWAACTHLTLLELGSECNGNRLTSLPPTLAQLTRLVDLDVSNNLLQQWPLLPPALLHLKMTGNQLTSLPPDLLVHCPHLITVDVSSNTICALPSLFLRSRDQPKPKS
ncbi:L domain-like protein [Hesseltinella vesiculosa]|uniref:L domain-like protein n=1 Tax=Hesseltinella vesiculosa TaxID=101127 RepID=A0A1X2G3Z6_9FUNG|nr:L domain-like protein [Hesseltinella vesiculosa]